MVAALRADGVAAPLVSEGGAINGPSFLARAERFLAPALRPGGVAALDGLGSHKVAGVREATEARGATRLCLQPCSPDLDPIEPASSGLKRPLRTAAARTADAPCDAIGAALRRFAPAERASHPRHCGHPQSGR